MTPWSDTKVAIVSTVQVVPSREVRIVPASPTITSRAAPSVTPFNVGEVDSSAIGDGCLSNDVPLGDVWILPSLPTATNWAFPNVTSENVALDELSLPPDPHAATMIANTQAPRSGSHRLTTAALAPPHHLPSPKIPIGSDLIRDAGVDIKQPGRFDCATPTAVEPAGSRSAAPPSACVQQRPCHRTRTTS